MLIGDDLAEWGALTENLLNSKAHSVIINTQVQVNVASESGPTMLFSQTEAQNWIFTKNLKTSLTTSTISGGFAVLKATRVFPGVNPFVVGISVFATVFLLFPVMLVAVNFIVGTALKILMGSSLFAVEEAIKAVAQHFLPPILHSPIEVKLFALALIFFALYAVKKAVHLTIENVSCSVLCMMLGYCLWESIKPFLGFTT